MPDAGQKGVKAVAWIDSPTPLEADGPGVSSIWIRQSEIIDAPLGRGRLVLFGPEIAWRAQPHGTFKFLFNGIYAGVGALTAAGRL